MTLNDTAESQDDLQNKKTHNALLIKWLFDVISFTSDKIASLPI